MSHEEDSNLKHRGAGHRVTTKCRKIFIATGINSVIVVMKKYINFGKEKLYRNNRSFNSLFYCIVLGGLLGSFCLKSHCYG